MVNKRPGRPRGEASARQRLLDAAQAHFEAGDLDRLSSRSLAAEVGVSHTLVNFHFGSRDALFAVVIALRVAPHQVVAASRDSDGHLDLPRLVRRLVAVWEHPVDGTKLVASARQLAANGSTGHEISTYLQHSVFGPLTEEFGQERARRMATAIVGVIFARYVLELPAMTVLTPAQVATHLLSMLR